MGIENEVLVSKELNESTSDIVEEFTGLTLTSLWQKVWYGNHCLSFDTYIIRC